MNTEKRVKSDVEFGGIQLGPVLGMIAGVIMFLGLPLIVLIFGQHLPVTIQITLIVLGIVIGGLMALVAGFFGAVMPSKVCCDVHKDPNNPCCSSQSVGDDDQDNVSDERVGTS